MFMVHKPKQENKANKSNLYRGVSSMVEYIHRTMSGCCVNTNGQLLFEAVLGISMRELLVRFQQCPFMFIFGSRSVLFVFALQICYEC